MAERRNVLIGYEMENAEAIPDTEDPGIGLRAGDAVTIHGDHDIYPGEEGIVQGIARGEGMYRGSLVIDVLVEGTDEAWRFRPHEIEEAL